jgi:hypothetical protein
MLQQLDSSIRDHVAQMIDAASTQYHCVIRVNQTQRTPEQAQTFHILHMYLHNFFPHLRPRFLALDKRTISWDHLSDPGVQWVLIDNQKSQFLKTAQGSAAQLTTDPGGKKKWLVEPDKTASSKAMADYLKSHGVKSMAAPGKDRCGEPCLCGGLASKHVSGKAADLSGLEELGIKIFTASPSQYTSAEDAVDQFLHTYHLWRPLAHLKGKAQELWHVEALPAPVHKAHHPQQKAHAHRHAVHARHSRRHGC